MYQKVIVFIALIYLPGTEHISELNLVPEAATEISAPALTVPSPEPPSDPDNPHTETERTAEAEHVSETQSDENVAAEQVSDQGRETEELQELEKLQEQSIDEVVVEEAEVADAAQVGQPHVDVKTDVELEFEKEQLKDAEDGVLLSEKERQNEEVNEKDNCSASSISSTSSTLEREEREAKPTNDIEAGTAETSFMHFPEQLLYV